MKATRDKSILSGRTADAAAGREELASSGLPDQATMAGFARATREASPVASAAPIEGDGGDNTISGTAGDDTIDGLDGNDKLSGLDGDDVLNGGTGDDILDGGNGRTRPSPENPTNPYFNLGGDTLDGGDGIDTVSFASAEYGIQAGLATSKADTAPQGNGQATAYITANRVDNNRIFYSDIPLRAVRFQDSIFNLDHIENLTGSGFQDFLTGSAENNYLSGGAGSDIIFGDNNFLKFNSSFIDENGRFRIADGNIYAQDDVLDPGAGPQTIYKGAVSRPDIVKAASTVNNSFASAMTINTGENGDFDLDRDANIDDYIFSIAQSQLIPHATVRATTAGGVDYYAIHLEANTLAWIDIDNNRQNDGTDFGFDVSVYDKDGDKDVGAQFNQLNYHIRDHGDTGSLSAAGYVEAYQTGTYYLRVEQSLATSDTPFMPAGITYTLNISYGKADVTYDGTTHAGYEYLSGGSPVQLGDAKAYHGNDTVTFQAASGGVTASLAIAGIQETGGAGAVEMDEINNLTGSRFDDVLTGDATDNILRGGDGRDALTGDGGDDTIDGGIGDDTLTGGAGFDVIDGGNGDDTVYGNQNDDEIRGGDGNDTLYGGQGSDRLFGGNGDDVVDGGNRAELAAVARPDVIKTQDRDVSSRANAIILDSAPGGDFSLAYDPNITDSRIIPHASIDAVASGIPGEVSPYNDRVGEYYGFDVTAGQTVNFDIDNNLRSDGTPFSPILFLFDANGNHLGDYKYIFLEDAQPDFSTGVAPYYSDGYSGRYNGNDPGSYLGAANLTYTFDKAGRYFITVGDVESGQSDNTDIDLLIAGTQYRLNVSTLGASAEVVTGDDVIDGGDGIDTASYATAPGGVTVDLTRTDVQDTGGGGHDQLLNIENLTGSTFADTLTGNAGDNVVSAGFGQDRVSGGAGADTLYGNQDADILYGNEGRDALYGGQGDDTLYGGQDDDLLQGGRGADTLSGGFGADRFRYMIAEDSTRAAFDTITDFQSGEDKIDLRTVHTSLADRFTITATGGNSFVDVDLGGDGGIDMRILVEGTIATGDVLWGGEGRRTAGAALAGTTVQAFAGHQNLL